MDRLREETRDEHEATEATDLARAMYDGTMSVPAYKAQLRAYHQLHHALERSLDAAAKGSPEVRAVVVHAGKKTSPLSMDLDRLADVIALDSRELRAAVAATVRFVTSVDAAVLLGALYVLEGSAMGAIALTPRLQAGLKLPDDALAYYRGHGSKTRERWTTFSALMDAALPDAGAQDRAVGAARKTFADLRAIFDTITAAEEAARQQLERQKQQEREWASEGS